MSLLCAGITVVPAVAQFGLGITVYDPTNWLQLARQITEMERQYTQLLNIYGTVTNQYRQIVTNARMIGSKARWRAALTPWIAPQAGNTYGTTGGWIVALNSGSGSLAGYQQAVTPLRNYGPVWERIDNSQQTQIGRNYATVELSDGVTVNALDQLGKVRANSGAVENAIDTLETDSLSDAEAMNTEVGVLNKINAGSVIGVRNGQDTNKLLASILDHQMVEAKARRDAEVQSINNDIALRQMAADVDDQHLTGSTEILRSYRLP